MARKKGLYPGLCLITLILLLAVCPFQGASSTGPTPSIPFPPFSFSTRQLRVNQHPRGPSFFPAEFFLTELTEEEIAGERYFRLVDEEGNTITLTGRRIRPGDRYLDEGNRLFEVYRVEERVAKARYLRTEDLSAPDRSSLREFLEQPGSDLPGPALYGNFSLKAGPAEKEGEEEEPAGEKNRLVAIYHTHNAESYVPSDNTHSIYGRGGIHKVGEAFKEALEEKGIDVIHSQRLHLPHDRGAYRRARNTVLELLKENPDVIFDVHRDAAPWDAYAIQIDGDWVTQIQFVVGRLNPSYSVTKRFAYDLKGLADEVYPGLVKGIFMGWGNYNQDLTPLKLLLEVGSHQNTREAAKEGITLFADVVALYFYGIPVEEESPFPPDGGGIAYAVAFIILLLLGGLAAFYFLNNPGAWHAWKKKAGLYLGHQGLVWKEGRQNLAELGQSLSRGLSALLCFCREMVRSFSAALRQRGKR